MLVTVLQFGIYKNCPIYLLRHSHPVGALDFLPIFVLYLHSSPSNFCLLFPSVLSDFSFLPALGSKLASTLKLSSNSVFLSSYTVPSFSLSPKVSKATTFSTSALWPHISSLDLSWPFLPLPFPWTLHTETSRTDSKHPNPRAPFQFPFCSLGPCGLTLP